MRPFVAFALAIVFLLWAWAPRHVDLGGFDADRMAEREAAMWRDEFAHHPVRQFARAYAGNRVEFGFSPVDSLWLALDAARAARAFQPTRSRAEAEVAAPLLERYYARLASAASPPFAAQQAARLELDGWQARRQASPPEDYGRTIARIAALVYGRDNCEIEDFGQKRAQAMALRDARGATIGEDDWREISERLRLAYRALREGLSSPAVAKRSS